MTERENKKISQEYFDTTPQSALERELLTQFFRDRGYKMDELYKLSKTERKRLMIEACKYASLKLTEIEAKAGFRKKIKYDSS